MVTMGRIFAQAGGPAVSMWKSGSAPNSPATPLAAPASPGGQLVDSTTMRHYTDFLEFYRSAIVELSDEHFFQCCVQFRRLAAEVAKTTQGDVLGSALDEQAWMLRNVTNSRKAQLNPHVTLPEDRVLARTADHADEFQSTQQEHRPHAVYEDSARDFSALDEHEWALRDVSKTSPAIGRTSASAPYDQWRLHRSPNVRSEETKQEARRCDEIDDQEHYLRKCR